MAGRSTPAFCERCGLRFELEQPVPGERDLGLDRIKASFRYCAGCRLFVGRTCCWNPDAVACIVDAPLFSPSATLLPTALPDGGKGESVAIRGIRELAASVKAVERLSGVLDPKLKPGEDRDVARQAWDEAWWATGWLIAQAETSRDAAAKALLRVDPQPGEPGAEALNGELASLLATYGEVRTVMEKRLVSAGRQLAVDADRQPVAAPPRRIERHVLLRAGSLAAVAVLAFGGAALLQLGYLDPFGSIGNSVASDPDGAVLGGVGAPAPSSTPAPLASPAAEAVIARLDFDELRVGLLAGATDEIGPVAGGPEVVAFPSPFDRSVRISGNGTHRFCLPLTALEEGRIAFDVDVYSDAPPSSGRLRLSMSPAGAGPSAATVPLELLRALEPEAWHQLRIAWEPGHQVAIAIGAEPDPTALSLPPASDPGAVSGAVCVTASGMAQDAALLLDNLRVAQ